MWLISPELYPPLFFVMFVVMVGIVAGVVRRKAGWGWLIVVWLGFSMLGTGFFVIWGYCLGPATPEETRTYAMAVVQRGLPAVLALSGIAVWLAAIIVPPRTAPEEAPSTGAPGRPEDTHALLGLPRRYEALLVAYREARQQAVRRPWYRTMFSLYVPSYVREDVASTIQFWRTPDWFMTAFVTAAPVVIALSEMPTARLSALEAYHRVNLTRVRQRLRPVKWLFGLLPAIIIAASRALPSGTLDIKNWWEAVRASILAFGPPPTGWDLMIMGIVSLVLGLGAGLTSVWWMQRRLEGVGELLTVALAQRRVEAFGDTGSGGVSRPGGRVDG